jgi:transposase
LWVPGSRPPERYDKALTHGIIHSRLRDWHEGSHPGYSHGCWLRGCKDQVLLFTTDFRVDSTNNFSERGAKAAKRHQAVSGYWRSLSTLARWCRIRSHLDSAMPDGVSALDAIRDAFEGTPWLPPLPALA